MLNFYLYSISAISLSIFYFAVLVAVGGVLRLLSGTSPLDQLAAQETLARGAGFALLGLPLWWLHWRWLRDQFSKASGYAVTWHRFYLFTIVCLSAIVMLFAGGAGFSGLLELVLGGSAAAELENTGVYLAALVLSSALWLHHWRQFKGGMGELNPQPIVVQEPTAT
jgi:hypothetical protein